MACNEVIIKRGFSVSNRIDFLDGGPKVLANTKNIRTFRDSKSYRVIDSFKKNESAEDYLITTGKLDNFQLACGGVVLVDNNEIKVSEYLLDLLEITKGDTVNIVKLLPEKKVPNQAFDIFVSNQRSQMTMRNLNELHRHRDDHDPIFSRRFSEWYQMVSTSLKVSGSRDKER